MSHASPVRRYALATLGSLALALGIVGIVVPVLPTTPFLLLASYCYLRSSARLYRWLMGHRVLGPYISNYVHHRAITRRARYSALGLLWLTLGISIALTNSLHLALFLLAVGLGVSVHLFCLKTLRLESAGADDNLHRRDRLAGRQQCDRDPLA